MCDTAFTDYFLDEFELVNSIINSLLQMIEIENIKLQILEHILIYCLLKIASLKQARD